MAWSFIGPMGSRQKEKQELNFAMLSILLQLLWKLLVCLSRNQWTERNKRHSAAYHFCIHLMMLKHLHNIPLNILKCLETGLFIMTDGLPVPVIPSRG